MPEHGEAPRAVTRWEGVSALAVDVAVRPEVAAGLLPEELELDAQPAATLVVAALPASNAGPAYRETALIYRVISGGLPRRYCAWSVVDNFAAVVLGAELFGFPRRMGRVSLDVSDDRVAASHWCSGAQVLSVQADLGSEVPSGGPVYGGRSVARAESIFDTAELVERRPLVESIVNQRAARVSISIDRDCDDAGPLAALITTGALDGRFATIDLALPGRASDATHDGVDPRDGAGTDVTGDGAERATPVVFTGLGAASMLTPLYTNIG